MSFNTPKKKYRKKQKTKDKVLRIRYRVIRKYDYLQDKKNESIRTKIVP